MPLKITGILEQKSKREYSSFTAHLLSIRHQNIGLHFIIKMPDDAFFNAFSNITTKPFTTIRVTGLALIMQIKFCKYVSVIINN